MARRAGVARITVSRALNRPHTVSCDLRERIDSAIDELGYLPNRLAGSLASATTPVVPLIVPSLSNAVFLEVIRGVQTVLEESGYQMLLGNTDYDLDREAALIQTLLRWSPAGAIIAGLHHRERTVQLLRRWGRPVVEVMEYGEPTVDLNVGLSHHAAGAAMARHFLDRGYRRPGFVGTLAVRRRTGSIETSWPLVRWAGATEKRPRPPRAMRGSGRPSSRLLGKAPAPRRDGCEGARCGTRG